MFQIKSFLLDCTSGPGFGEYYTTPDLFVVDEMNSIIYGCNYNYPDYIFRYDINDVYNH